MTKTGDLIESHDCGVSFGLNKWKGSLRDYWELEVYDKSIEILYCPFCGLKLE